MIPNGGRTTLMQNTTFLPKTKWKSVTINQDDSKICNSNVSLKQREAPSKDLVLN